MSAIRIVSGAGHYADPYHDFAATSARIADVARQSDHDVMIDDVEAGMRDLSGVDLLIANFGVSTGGDGADARAVEAIAGLRRHLDRGASLLVVHASATALPAAEEWEHILGGRWVAGTSMHPKIGAAHVRVRTDAHPIVDGLEDFEVYDERYSYLRVADHVTPLIDHEHDGIVHALAWIHQHGNAKVGYDALGHGVESYDSHERCELLRREIDFLL